ncbi:MULTISPECIES: hypothetical protein [unclassified Pseudoalteromonas]|uniref:hypothetical protein n=1 Tax=unclassified Pseudoalteromonas TaxID=194690 RepID=UPI002097C198|nr:hypothetical protein [Pseudoalteromonas sp. XMcav2-N]MCO7190904.1 hypothetical protein [Pseudoalteromonas sp. XMcav2-N]
MSIHSIVTQLMRHRRVGMLATLLAVAGLLPACSSKPSVDEEAEALARAELIKTYNEHKAGIERVAAMEQDLSQLLTLLSSAHDIQPLEEKIAQPEKNVVTHQVAPASASELSISPSKGSIVVQFGRHLLNARAQAQNERIRASLSLIQSYYPEMFNTVSLYLQTPAVNGTQFYLSQASGFMSVQESAVFCRLIQASGQPCKLVN